MKKEVKKILLKDLLFNKTKVEQIAMEIQRAYPSFKSTAFVREILIKFPELELKARITCIAENLSSYLPNDYKKAVQILINALPPPNNPNLSDDDFGDFIYAPYAEYVARNGCTKENLHTSLEALHEITQRFSAEDAIRFFLNKFPKETLKELLRWTHDTHYHVRRLCSEGTRPKLPWSQKISLPITAPLPILNNLFSDKTRFVTRSVANHLNDISKTDPDLTLSTLRQWRQSKKQEFKEMNYIIRHGLRTLIKQGNPEAMNMLGFDYRAKIHISKFLVPKNVAINTLLQFSFTITASENSNVLIDYILHFQNKEGKLSKKKVFKLKTLVLKKDIPVLVEKHHMLRERMTTRTLYRGKHLIELQVNGVRIATESFLLK